MKYLTVLSVCCLSACGSLYKDNPLAGVAQAAQAFVSGDSEDTATPGLFDTINREFIEAQPNDLMLVSILDRGAAAAVFEAGRNGSIVTWLSPDGISVSTQSGIVVATRGLGGDIMAIDPSPSLRGFGSNASYSKVYEYLDGRDQITTDTFTCEMSAARQEVITLYERRYDTVVYEEFCENDEFLIRNVFWRAQDGIIWQSRQWISADVGYLGYQRL